jgi:hypothetical protein
MGSPPLSDLRPAACLSESAVAGQTFLRNGAAVATGEPDRHGSGYLQHKVGLAREAASCLEKKFNLF